MGGVIMAWMQKLYETYEKCSGNSRVADSDRLLPLAHTTQQAHVEVVLDGMGNFRRASLLQKEETVIPATEKSAGRTSGEAPHPLCDKIQYCAADYPKFGGTKGAYFESYCAQLSAWCSSPYVNAKVCAVLAYVKKGCLVQDLVNTKILVASDNQLVIFKKATGEKKSKGKDSAPATVFKFLTPNPETGEIDQGDALVRWRIEISEDPCSGTWEDAAIKKSWQEYELSLRTGEGFCMVEGRNLLLANQHPAKLRHGGDKAKIISSNDKAGFTYRGRFLDADQAAGVSFEVTQKAHSALRWLIGRKQAFRNDDQVFVAWSVGGQEIPDPWGNSAGLFGLEADTSEATSVSVGDVGQAFAERLKRAMAGYRTHLGGTEDIVVMGLDSATPGRMAISFYRELKGSEFLERVESWHANNSWPQNLGKNLKFVGAPSPKDIAEAAYGQPDKKLRKTTAERLLPCIIDGAQFPRDLAASCLRRTINRAGLEHWEFEKNLGITCAIYKGLNHERNYQMALEEGRQTRDYLYGRLLAVAEQIESSALWQAGEKRDTMAARLMQRFADRPYSTWRTMELSLTPYKARLRASRPGLLRKWEVLLDDLIVSFSTAETSEGFTNDRPLSGEFLLGYHCQRQALRPAAESESTPVSSNS